MTEIHAVLLAAVVGAVAGIGGAGFALLASIRASQLAARVPLAAKIHTLNETIVQLAISLRTPEYDRRMENFQKAWNDFAVHQKILCPSERLSILGMIVRDAASDSSIPPAQFVMMAGDAMNAASEIVARYSEHTFKWRARRAEPAAVEAFVSRSVRSIQSPDILRLLKHLKGEKDLPTRRASTDT